MRNMNVGGYKYIISCIRNMGSALSLSGMFSAQFQSLVTMPQCSTARIEKLGG